MSSAKFETKKLIGKNDFSLWRRKMNALLVQQGLIEALEPGPTLMTNGDRKKWMEVQHKAHFAMILWQANKVIKAVSHEETTLEFGINSKNSTCKRSLTNRLYMKQIL